ncbi:P-loop containing nucleoside triphosphate hydrolase protein [Pilaira anomala]|nr:P-loop containing nucleoside triphosphate hydrolase protein [Pilaira anomala]
MTEAVENQRGITNLSITHPFSPSDSSTASLNSASRSNTATSCSVTVLDCDQDDAFPFDEEDDLNLNELLQATEAAESNHKSISSSISSCSDKSMHCVELSKSIYPVNVDNLRTWIYPANYSIRQYQLNIVQKALFYNTLVVLPTGLGKTFIAAVVMYNYWRWFPNGKIIFMAPTKPLVSQQIEACFKVCGIPLTDTVDMTGSVPSKRRQALWKEKRVFFTTPHVVQNDLISKACPANQVVCIVIDEAHKATGNYAYVKVANALYKTNRHFRVLALSATPGTNVKSIQSVIDNLYITKIESRTEESIDVQNYVFKKNTESIIVPLISSSILRQTIKELRDQALDPLLKDLSKLPCGVSPNIESNSAFGLQLARVRFTNSCKNMNPAAKYSIIQKFLITEQMCRSYDLLCQHGIIPFIESIEFEDKKKNFVLQDATVQRLLKKLKQDIQHPNFISHPKIDKMVSILLSHFNNLTPGSFSKVIVFSSYRSSVTEICKVLNRHMPIIRCSSFVGQAEGKGGSKGLNQAKQLEVIRKFKNNEINVLVSTSIGEEGLDIGEVDVIICYDSQSSPLRMLQRLGRTGRERQGKCIMLMTHSEQEKFNQAKATYANVQRIISQGTQLTYHHFNPSVLPLNPKPTLSLETLTIGQYKQEEKKKKKKKRGDNNLYTEISMTSEGFMKPSVERAFIRSFCNGQEQYDSLCQVIESYWPKVPVKKSLCTNIPLQSSAKPTFRVGHSKRTLDFVKIVQKMEHCILNSEEEDSSFNNVLTNQQEKLFLPTKVNSLDKLIMNKKKRKESDENEYSMERNSLVDYFDPDASSPTINNFDPERSNDNLRKKRKLYVSKSNKS